LIGLGEKVSLYEWVKKNRPSDLSVRVQERGPHTPKIRKRFS
jgi:hypothetical protein